MNKTAIAMLMLAAGIMAASCQKESEPGIEPFEPMTVKPVEIILKVWKREIPYFDSLPLHSSQQRVADNEEYSIYHYFMAPTWDLERRLLECNDHVEVLAPQDLRDMMAEHAHNMVDMYNGKWD